MRFLRRHPWLCLTLLTLVGVGTAFYFFLLREGPISVANFERIEEEMTPASLAMLLGEPTSNDRAPEGRQSIARGVNPWIGGRLDVSPGGATVQNLGGSLPPLPGLWLLASALFQGFTPLATHFRPSAPLGGFMTVTRTSRRRRWLWVVLIVFAIGLASLLFLVLSPKRITRARFDKLQTGMTHTDVARAFGQPTIVESIEPGSPRQKELVERYFNRNTPFDLIQKYCRRDFSASSSYGGLFGDWAAHARIARLDAWVGDDWVAQVCYDNAGLIVRAELQEIQGERPPWWSRLWRWLSGR
ncbi:MAG: hypothetical protein L0Y72_31115 [Gemmataceae bacterium]|nr:hypothetical protein [Gemmataceae bacterium]MCI0743501.1 hypothetical protein [Gemmataceae bacterium]